MRVLDLSRLLPGPYCSRILADFGFQVIKIERPGGGDWSRLVPPLDAESGEGMLFRALNRGKMSLTLDLKSDEGRAIFLRLAKTADVLLETFRPGVMERLNLGHETISQANPRIIYCSLSGYGPEGPYQTRAGHDLGYQGLAGLLDLTGPRDGPPAVPGTQLADLSGALWSAVGILFALLERERTGLGQRVDGSLLGGALSLLPLAVTRQQGGQPMARSASDLNGGLVCYNVYETRDGQYMTLAALEPEFWGAFCLAAGCEGLMSQQFAPALPGELAYEELCSLFRSRTQQEWVETLAGVDACCEPVYSVGEALGSPAVQALGLLTEMGLRPPIRLSNQEGSKSEVAPSLSQHTTLLLAELGYSPDETEQLRARGLI